MLWVLLVCPHGTPTDHLKESSKEPQTAASQESTDAAAAANGSAGTAADHGPGAACIEAIVLPTSTGRARRLLRSNDGRVNHFENDNCKGSWIALHDPADPTAPYGQYFAGKKRRWEIRWQLEFKQTPKGAILFGWELEEYLPLSVWSRQLQALVVRLLQKCVGGELYHSQGDDPRTHRGEVERPCFSMPLWAFDQVIVSLPGQEPDIAAAEGLERRGVRRSAGRAAFIQTVSDLSFEPGKVYTFSFWCISRFLDPMRWEIVGLAPGRSISFNTFCGKPPVDIGIYELVPDEKETRHLQSRKKYLFHASVWSSQNRPDAKRMADLVPKAEASTVHEPEAKEPRGLRRWIHRLALPCLGRM